MQNVFAEQRLLFFLISVFMHELFNLLGLENNSAGLYWESYELRKCLHTQDHYFNIYIAATLPEV